MQTVATRIAALAERGGARRASAGSWASNRGQVKFTGARARHRGQADQGPERRGARPRQPGHHARASAWSAASTPTTTAPRSRTSAALCSGHDRRPRPAALRGDARHRRPGRADRARRRTRAGHPAAGRGERLDHEAGRALVRAGQRRPHRRAAREEALRAGRDGAAAGAHAVPRGDGAGRGRARRRDRDAGGRRCAATTRRSS